MAGSAQNRKSPVRKHFLTQSQYLRNIDPSFLKGASCGVVSAKVPIFAPMAAESTVHARQAPVEPETEIRSVLQRCISGNELYIGTDLTIHLNVRRFIYMKIRSWQKTKTKPLKNQGPNNLQPNTASIICSYFCISQQFHLFRLEVLWSRGQCNYVSVRSLAHFWAL